MRYLIAISMLCFLLLGSPIYAQTYSDPIVWNGIHLGEIFDGNGYYRLGYNITPTQPIQLLNVTMGVYTRAINIFVIQQSNNEIISNIPIINFNQTATFNTMKTLYPNDSYYLVTQTYDLFTYSDIDSSNFPFVSDGLYISNSMTSNDNGVTWNYNPVVQIFDIENFAYRIVNETEVLQQFPTSYRLCYDSYTLLTNTTVYNNGLPNNTYEYSYCPTGCDSITSSCSPPKYQSDLLTIGIIIGIFLFFIWLIRRKRR